MASSHAKTKEMLQTYVAEFERVFEGIVIDDDNANSISIDKGYADKVSTFMQSFSLIIDMTSGVHIGGIMQQPNDNLDHTNPAVFYGSCGSAMCSYLRCCRVLSTKPKKQFFLNQTSK
jgi:hypothetical protein